MTDTSTADTSTTRTSSADSSAADDTSAAESSATSVLAAVLFDMDGTLLDSEKVWDVALEQLADWLGGTLTPATRERMVGTPLGRSIALLHEDLGIDADPESSGAYLLDRAAELFSRELPWKPGAHDVLVAVRDAGIPAALVTSTHRSLTEKALETIGREFFAVTVCGDEVRATKPDPAPYLQAAEQLGVDPRWCVVIEDSPVGVAAGEAAGCAVLAVPSEVPLGPGPRRTLRDSLVGVTVEELAALVR